MPVVDEPPESEAGVSAALIKLERHVSGCLSAIAELRELKARVALKELRASGTLACVRSLRVFVVRERKARSS